MNNTTPPDTEHVQFCQCEHPRRNWDTCASCRKPMRTDDTYDIALAMYRSVYGGPQTPNPASWSHFMQCAKWHKKSTASLTGRVKALEGALQLCETALNAPIPYSIKGASENYRRLRSAAFEAARAARTPTPTTGKEG